MGAKRLTKTVIGKIRKRRAQGAGYEALAREFGVSQGSVRNALRGARTRAASSPSSTRREEPEATAEPAGPPPSRDDVRAWLGEQVSDLRADAKRLRARGDVPALERCNRALVTASMLLARFTPEPPKEDGFVRVAEGDIAGAAERVRAKLHGYIEHELRSLAAGPRCPACGRPDAAP